MPMSMPISQFAGWVAGSTPKYPDEEETKMEDEIGFRIYTHQFGNCKRLARLHLIPA